MIGVLQLLDLVDRLNFRACLRDPAAVVAVMRVLPVVRKLGVQLLNTAGNNATSAAAYGPSRSCETLATMLGGQHAARLLSTSASGTHRALLQRMMNARSAVETEVRAALNQCPPRQGWLAHMWQQRRWGSHASEALRVSSGAGAVTSSSVSSAQAWGGAALSAGLSDSACRQLTWWLGGSAVWVYSMIVLGGVTRLTKSGLSMTEWKFTGEKRPSSAAEWEEEFAKYKESPEYQKLHRGMTLPEFKFIYYMEYAHRMWGRLLGLGFAIPGTYFLARGFINRPLARRLGLLFLMGGMQGLVGWWMVRSGLQIEHEHDTPRVSPYRLAAHLVSAFTIYATLVWTTADMVRPAPLLEAASGVATSAARTLRGKLLPLAALVAVTASSGAFVAGMEAGRAYNTWPLMGGHIIPEEYWDPATPGLRNFFENTAAVQFDHRMLATATLGGMLALWAWGRTLPLPHAARLGLNTMAIVTAAQFVLGIYTLLEYVPPHLGSLHQANALNLFTAVLLTLHVLRPACPPGPAIAVLQRAIAPAAVAAVAAIGVAVTTNK